MPAPITQAEVARVFKGMCEAGVADGRVVIERPDGTKVSIIAGKGAEAEAPADNWDDILGRAE